jgi:nucleotide-binding universal stress UspA family protein
MTQQPVIHVGVDGSWRDTGALEWALQESTLRQEPLRVVHVIDAKSRHAPGGEPGALDEASARLIDDVRKHLDEHQGLQDHRTDLVVGSPARALTDLATGSRMLVVGRRGIGTFKRLLIGSTSEAVAIGATVPTVIVPERWTPSDHAGPVIVAVDDSDDNRAVIEFAIAAAVERNLPLQLTHVWDLPAIYSWDAMNVAGVSTEWTENAERHFENVAAEWRAKYPELTIRVDVRRGHVVDGIVTAAAAADAQLLVLGSRHHWKVTSLLGSVTRGVLHHAPCPLAVVPA